MSSLGVIEGKTFLITGAASGLGAGYVEPLLKEGAKNIAILDIAVDKGTELANSLNKQYPDKVLFVKCNISREEDIQTAFNEVLSKFGKLDVIINNAGVLNDSPKIWRTQCELNYAGLVSLTLKGIKHMRVDEGGNGGTIINVSSTLALVRYPSLPIYSGTKAGVLHFSQCLSMDPFYSQTGVRILTICYGATDTPLLGNLGAMGYDDFTCKLMETKSDTPFQRPESAIKGLVDMFKRGSNGSVWLATHDRPVQDITADLNAANDHIVTKYGLE